MDIVDPRLEEYAAAHTTSPEPLFAELSEETHATLDMPQMLTGTIEGRFLELLVHGLQARRVLELGTFSGYGTLSMAAGLPPDGRIDSCEISEQHAEVARQYIERAGHADRITVHVGPALDSIRSLEGDFDFVFIDADKENYVAYYEEVLPRLSPTGLIAADNTLWSGRVLDESDQEASTKAIRAFNDHVVADTRVTSVMLSVRDGVTLVRQK